MNADESRAQYVSEYNLQKVYFCRDNIKENLTKSSKV
jgi:hypothetical protein